MSPTEVINLAQKAGFYFHDAGYGPEVLHTDPLKYSQQCFERFAELVIDHTKQQSGPIAWMYQDHWGTHFTDDKREWVDGLNIETVYPLFIKK